MNRSLLTLAVLTAAALSSAFDFDDVILWTGSGPNRAMFVLDFNDGSAPQSFAWGFRWSGSATSEDMFRAIDAGDPRLQATILGQGGVGFGAYLDSLLYDADGDGTFERSGPAWPTGWWEFYGRPSANDSWVSQSVGMSSRALTDGAWDGWSYVRNNVRQAPETPVAAVPEPATLAALGLGVLALARRRRA